MTRPFSFARPKLPVGLLAALLLSGCASDGGKDFPSLARRPIEGVLTGVQTEPAAVAPVPAGASLREKLAAWRTDSVAADRAFQAALPGTEARVGAASGAAAGSDGWMGAHQALSRLDILRGPMSRIWADVDALFVARTVAGDPEGAAEIAALHSQLAAMAAAQIGHVERLAAQIAPR
jgi:hypothetical protein